MAVPREIPSGIGRPILAWAAVAVWAAMIFGLSAQQDLRILPDDGLDFVVRKIGHAGVFGILALLLWRAALTTTRRRAPAWALVIAIAYAITDEIHQGSVVGRHASAVDVAIDAAGALLAVALVGAARAALSRHQSST